ncbi:HPP family protein [Colletotrichum graminicola]|uniref:HPP family protein n=1 Tax=Colletotrichum graminicola (strain M1.001 / M2 / FGSC 10212) TaxID=645133 RepID=E3QKX7_COLGM|nr:HPP family protein [Colletotrichum graminicola M1.001]EFQ31515.1 HPP family protein [Colletotrichum graminicola M1.001]WDK10258.1 HPP family protein [Colletotrichum graminicola]
MTRPSMLRCDPREWNFDIDRFINPFIPHPPWEHLPYPIAHFFGYRKAKPINAGNIVPVFWACIGVFCGVAVVALVSRQIPVFREHGAPIIVGSFGAAAVLEFYSIESPLAQPRNSVFGQVLAALVGVAVCKLLQLSPHFESIRWLGGALSCALATTVMALTKTVHPPAGATALLAVVDDGIVRLGWILVPIVTFGSVIMLVVALFINNVQRCFPQYWWSPEDLRVCSVPWRRRGDLESRENVAFDGIETRSSGSESTAREDAVLIMRPGEVVVPKHLFITPEEKMFLEGLSNRL